MSTATAEKKPERIRGSSLAVLVKYSNNVPFEEGLRKANDQNLVIASSKRLSQALLEFNEWRGIEAALPCWTGTMTGYEAPGKKFGKTIEYVDPKTDYRWVFPVPESYRGKKNAILVAEHPDYTLETDGRNRVVHATSVDLVKQFPTKLEHWYKGDPKHDIPQGKPVSSDNKDARCLWRIKKRVGPVARNYKLDYIRSRVVDLSLRPSIGFGVAVEVPKMGAPKLEGYKISLELSGVSKAELKDLLKRFAENLEVLGDVVGEELLGAARKLETILRQSTFKE
ncbi:hypothetical protein JXA56_03300 [Candidatus Micrarchaeota archaeon]|nr:hypothetical protein [Candidatus Micrarchaeota archaeon]